MKTYEAVVIFTSDENPYREAREAVKKEFETAGIVITKEEDMGEKLLAYPVGRHDRGRYVLYTIEGNAESLKAVEPDAEAPRRGPQAPHHPAGCTGPIGGGIPWREASTTSCWSATSRAMPS